MLRYKSPLCNYFRFDHSFFNASHLFSRADELRDAKEERRKQVAKVSAFSSNLNCYPLIN